MIKQNFILWQFLFLVFEYDLPGAREDDPTAANLRFLDVGCGTYCRIDRRKIVNRSRFLLFMIVVKRITGEMSDE